MALYLQLQAFPRDLFFGCVSCALMAALYQALRLTRIRGDKTAWMQGACLLIAFWNTHHSARNAPSDALAVTAVVAECLTVVLVTTASRRFLHPVWKEAWRKRQAL